MKAVIQRAAEASVAINGKIAGKCGRGLLILLGAARGDNEDDALFLAEKISKMRIFEDDNGKMNLSVNDICGEALIISNFTLCANCRRGNRPDFLGAESPERAKELYELFIKLLRERLKSGCAEHGEFGADMQVSLINDGPVTIILDTTELRK